MSPFWWGVFVGAAGIVVVGCALVLFVVVTAELEERRAEIHRMQHDD